MMVIRFILSLLTIPLGALLGSWLGEQVRSQLGGTAPRRWQLVHQTAAGDTVIALNPRLTHFVPGLVTGLLGRPHLLLAFAGSFASGLLLGNRLEAPLWQLLREQTEA